jgi:hypothetical protein
MNEQRAVIQQMVDALDHADELLGGNDTLVMNGAAAGRWLLEQPAVQEPVAQCTNSDTWNCKYCRKTETCEALEDPRNFATPPAQPVPVKTYHDGKPWPVQPKPWVGLTADEMLEALTSVDPETKRLPVGFSRFARAIEAKLKEKNT